MTLSAITEDFPVSVLKTVRKRFPCQLTYRQGKFKLFPSVFHRQERVFPSAFDCQGTQTFSVGCLPSGLPIYSRHATLPTRLTFRDGFTVQ